VSGAFERSPFSVQSDATKTRRGATCQVRLVRRDSPSHARPSHAGPQSRRAPGPSHAGPIDKGAHDDIACVCVLRLAPLCASPASGAGAAEGVYAAKDVALGRDAHQRAVADHHHVPACVWGEGQKGRRESERQKRETGKGAGRAGRCSYGDATSASSADQHKG
jgi:hypothetical protein